MVDIKTKTYKLSSYDELDDLLYDLYNFYSHRVIKLRENVLQSGYIEAIITFKIEK